MQMGYGLLDNLNKTLFEISIILGLVPLGYNVSNIFMQGQR